MSNLFTALQQEQEQQQHQVQQVPAANASGKPQRVTREVTPIRAQSRTHGRDNPREKLRSETRDFPTRDEVQEFSFRLRDTLKVKVQAEVPHQWQRELDDIARDLDVKKLELYRYILGEFLGKVQRQSRAAQTGD